MILIRRVVGMVFLAVLAVIMSLTFRQHKPYSELTNIRFSNRGTSKGFM